MRGESGGRRLASSSDLNDVGWGCKGNKDILRAEPGGKDGDGRRGGCLPLAFWSDCGLCSQLFVE